MADRYIIQLRDLNGRRERMEFPNRSTVLEWCESEYDEDEIEILLVVQLLDGNFPCVLYSGLGQDAPLTIEDMLGFFG